MNQEQQVTVRIQKVKKNRIRMKLIRICSTGSSTTADYDFCKVYLSL